MVIAAAAPLAAIVQATRVQAAGSATQAAATSTDVEREEGRSLARCQCPRFASQAIIRLLPFMLVRINVVVVPVSGCIIICSAISQGPDAHVHAHAHAHARLGAVLTATSTAMLRLRGQAV